MSTLEFMDGLGIGGGIQEIPWEREGPGQEFGIFGPSTAREGEPDSQRSRGILPDGPGILGWAARIPPEGCLQEFGKGKRRICCKCLSLLRIQGLE